MKFQFITDIEGHLPYLHKQIDASSILTLDKEKTRIDFLDDSYCLVIGGDVCDRGDDITVAHQLLDLKKRYPDRVFFIVGNRDLNKTRFSTELPLDPNYQFTDAPEAVVKPPYASKTYAEFLAGNENNPINRLKWILACTMGAPGAFECRRAELARLENKVSISDEEVYLSFRQSVEPNGFMREYLTQSQLLVRIGDTLMMHGGINENNYLKIPNNFVAFDKSQTASQGSFLQANDSIKKCASPDAWLAELNAWFEKAKQRWLDSKDENVSFNFSNDVPAAPMQHIGAGPGSYYQKISVVIARFLKDGFPAPIAKAIADDLQKHGINRFLSGHQPHGNTPVCITGSNDQTKFNNSEFQIFTCDTLYGHKDAYDRDHGEGIRSSDPRGASFCVVLVECDDDRKTSTVYLNGTDGYGAQYKKTICFPRKDNEDPFLGKIVEIDDKPYIVRLNSKSEEGEYTLSYVDGPFAVRYITSTRAELEILMQANVTSITLS